MENERTTLQNICDQKAEQIRIAIEQALADKKKIVRSIDEPYLIQIDGVFVHKYDNCTCAVVLEVSSEKIKNAFTPSIAELQAEYRREREKLQALKNEIEKIEREEPIKH